ncbi:GNAT family N-acetyltransferase [Sphingomonas sp. SUN039]|uniref:GNAT family N-acetyltransferase n=1 Tax=Sphingomonas sp. SUN039 TaxID=2937787 RepID=UPI0021642298|nr:GNAT family N-acetyltransferase [Sphingomonas sp. SUN039]UVO53414.1 GNAT family N-acetyltransferase [Sphingomonas sp. SUN039]
MIETARLTLRPWQNADIAPFMTATNTLAVSRWLGGLQDASHYADMASRMQAEQSAHGHCFWIVERRDDRKVLGLCGLRRAGHPGTPVHGKLEIGWRLSETVWGQGLAKEAALACISWGWDELRDDEQVAYTVPGNSASWGLMERLGMTRRSDLDFDHPMFPAGHELCRHIVYSIARPL